MRLTLQPLYPYSPGCLGSLSLASNVLLAQHQFPFKYSHHDAMVSADSDRCISWDRDRVTAIIKEYTGTGDQGLPDWCRHQPPCRILAFLKEVFNRPRPDPGGRTNHQALVDATDLLESIERAGKA